jgi:hypothetical protein
MQTTTLRITEPKSGAGQRDYPVHRIAAVQLLATAAICASVGALVGFDLNAFTDQAPATWSDTAKAIAAIALFPAIAVFCASPDESVSLDASASGLALTAAAASFGAPTAQAGALQGLVLGAIYFGVLIGSAAWLAASSRTSTAQVCARSITWFAICAVLFFNVNPRPW